jgi:hypothetical protein
MGTYPKFLTVSRMTYIAAMPLPILQNPEEEING